ncbi:adenylyltransferase/sulfurtransferase MoeZ [Clavibacter californiensis]|uniref:Adenylyltransferase/sulfurtransferase MoeZ n=1 Tax=Clavibacter californiensis TaxID=1401995 RepID=A0ABX9N8A1_9MICO|nr:adenylyltransferase/sulfurtransferase MoeZ [Clavibacter californiensis]
MGSSLPLVDLDGTHPGGRGLGGHGSGQDAHERRERHSRHLALPGIGMGGQSRIDQARVLVIGAGGLGSPVLQYLAAAGIGTLGIVDDDAVDLSNLQRQTIHGTPDVGRPKTTSAADSVHRTDPGVEVVEHAERLTDDNAIRILSGYDVVVDATDNFATRYLISDAAALVGVPCVWGSVYRWDAQVTVFWDAAPDGRGIDYRDVFPEPPADGAVLSCEEAGVFGAVCGTVGALMATEVIKLVTGAGTPLIGRVVVLDALAGTSRTIGVKRAKGRQRVTALADYDLFCGVGAASDGTELDAEAVERILASDESVVLLDVREPDERLADSIPGHVAVPVRIVTVDPGAVPGEITDRVIVYCASGVRSRAAAAALREAGRDAVSLRGGIQSWRSVAGRA